MHIGIYYMVALPAALLLQSQWHIEMKQIDHYLNTLGMKCIYHLMVMSNSDWIYNRISVWKHTAPADGYSTGIMSRFFQQSDILSIMLIKSGCILRSDTVMKLFRL